MNRYKRNRKANSIKRITHAQTHTHNHWTNVFNWNSRKSRQQSIKSIVTNWLWCVIEHKVVMLFFFFFRSCYMLFCYLVIQFINQTTNMREKKTSDSIKELQILRLFTLFVAKMYRFGCMISEKSDYFLLCYSSVHTTHRALNEIYWNNIKTTH